MKIFYGLIFSVLICFSSLNCISDNDKKELIRFWTENIEVIPQPNQTVILRPKGNCYPTNNNKNFCNLVQLMCRVLPDHKETHFITDDNYNLSFLIDWPTFWQLQELMKTT